MPPIPLDVFGPPPEGERPDEPSGWFDALFAGFVLEAAAGFAAGALAFAARPNGGVAMFFALSVAAAVTGASLVSGWLWTVARFAPLALLLRLAAALALLFTGAAIGFLIGLTVVLIPVSFFAAAALAGLGMALAERTDYRTGPDAPARVDVRDHIFGALAGVVFTFGGAMLTNSIDHMMLRTGGIPVWPYLAVGASTLVVASLPHDLMVTFARRRRGIVAPGRALLVRRAAIGGAMFVLLGVMLLLYPPERWG